MSRQSFRKQNGLRLPHALTQELGLSGDRNGGRSRKGRGGNVVADRKERRRVTRAEKRHVGLQQRQIRAQRSNDSRGDSETHQVEEDDEEPEVEVRPSKNNPPQNTTKASASKPILKEVAPRLPLPESPESSRSRSSSPGLVLDPNSTSFRKHAKEDDDEIAALERKLGIRGKKSTRQGDDMLSFVLGDFEDESGTQKRKREGLDWLDQKRRKVAKVTEEEEVDDTSEDKSKSGDDSDDLDEIASDAEQFRNDNDDEDDDFDGFESELGDTRESTPPKKTRENPYIAPVTPRPSGGKYVPPSLRKRTEGSDPSLEQLGRQVQGQLNKLSEANMISILGEIEKLYRSNSRQDMTTALISRIFTSFCVRSALQKTFVILHAAFLASVYKVMGADFGAELLTQLVERIDIELDKSDHGKEAYNLMNLLANLFVFNMVSNHLVYDYIRLLLSDFSENNTELLLGVTDACGTQLRQDDSSALKDIAQMVQGVSAQMAQKGEQTNVRTKFMMERIVDLKNNKLKMANDFTMMTGEHIKRMKKALGSLNSRPLRATEPLRITRADIANSEKTGKWWLVGASWKGQEPRLDASRQLDSFEEDDHQNSEAEDEVEFLSLAKQYRMNTDIRRSIFVAIMSANDCRDAQIRLLKLRLSTKQQQEIPRVLLRCARAEPAYNPYYALLAKSLCKDNKKIRMGFQFGLWDFFGRMGEKEDEGSDAEDGDSSVELHEIVNVAKMYAYLIFQGHLPIGILKTLNIGFLKDKATMFLEVLVISIMTQPKASEQELMKVFGRAIDTPQLVQSLHYFVKKNVRKSDLVSKEDKAQVKEGCEIASATFMLIESSAVE